MICAMRWCGAGFLLSMASGACYHGGEVCSNGQIMACEGADGCAGQQVCQGDGSFGACLCEAAPDDEASGSSGPSNGSTMTGVPPDESGSEGDSSECVPSSCDAMPEYCGTIRDDCGQLLTCECPSGHGCQEGVCQALCDTTYKIRNDKMDGSISAEDCDMDDPVPFTSKMLVARDLSGLEVLNHGEDVEIKVLVGEQETIEVGCCMVAEQPCPGFDDKCFCACEYHEILLVGGSCEVETIKGCQ